MTSMESRREHAGKIGMLFAAPGLLTVIHTTQPANAYIKGAAELDAEAYIRDLLRGNPPTGLDQSPIVVRPPRIIDKSFAEFLDQVTIDQISKTSGIPKDNVEKEVAELRQKLEPGFQRRAPFPSGDLSNEYCLDCYIYATFRVAAKLITDLRQRASFIRTLGDRVLSKIMTEKGIRLVKADENGLEDAFKGLSAILDYMKSKSFIKGFKINTENYDREYWDDGYSIELQVSVFEPATMGGNLQFTGEGFLYHPELIANTLESYLRQSRVPQAKWLQYFLDTEYRENPKDYAPTEILYQFILEKKTSASS